MSCGGSGKIWERQVGRESASSIPKNTQVDCSGCGECPCPECGKIQMKDGHVYPPASVGESDYCRHGTGRKVRDE